MRYLGAVIVLSFCKLVIGASLMEDQGSNEKEEFAGIQEQKTTADDKYKWMTEPGVSSPVMNDVYDDIKVPHLGRLRRSASLKSKIESKSKKPISKSKKKTPKGKEKTPNSKEKTPKSTERSPKSKEKTPKSTERSPKSKEKTQKNKEKSPKSKEKTPKSTERSPKSKEKTQKIKEKSPKSKEKTPKSKKKTPKGKEKLLKNIKETPKSKEKSPKASKKSLKSKSKSEKIKSNTPRPSSEALEKFARQRKIEQNDLETRRQLEEKRRREEEMMRKKEEKKKILEEQRKQKDLKRKQQLELKRRQEEEKKRLLDEQRRKAIEKKERIRIEKETEAEERSRKKEAEKKTLEEQRRRKKAEILKQQEEKKRKLEREREDRENQKKEDAERKKQDQLRLINERKKMKNAEKDRLKMERREKKEERLESLKIKKEKKVELFEKRKRIKEEKQKSKEIERARMLEEKLIQKNMKERKAKEEKRFAVEKKERKIEEKKEMKIKLAEEREQKELDRKKIQAARKREVLSEIKRKEEKLKTEREERKEHLKQQQMLKEENRKRLQEEKVQKLEEIKAKKIERNLQMQEEKRRKQEENEKKREELKMKQKEKQRLAEETKKKRKEQRQEQQKRQDEILERKRQMAERRADRITLREKKKQKYAGLCRCFASGDPHYKTFDGAMIHFMGTCEYVMARTDPGAEMNNCTFDVTVQNEHRNGRTRVSYTKRVNIHMFGMEVSLLKDKKLLINGIRQYTPLTVNEMFQVVKNSRAITFISNCGVEVSFRDDHMVEVAVPKIYAGQMNGICGTCNGVLRDDYTLADGTFVADRPQRDSQIGHSYIVDVLRPDLPERCQEADTAPPAPMCNALQRKKAVEQCGVMVQHGGPFRECLTTRKEIALELFDSCTQDFCASADDPKESTDLVCDALTALAEDCWESGVEVEWRSAALCPPRCPRNSYFTNIMPACPPSCANPEPTGDCTSDTQEGCLCDHGYLLNDNECVPVEQCGCVDPKTKSYFPTNASTLTRTCEKVITCHYSEITKTHRIRRRPAPPCSPHASCQLVEGQRQCVCLEGFQGDGYICSPRNDPEMARLKLAFEVAKLKERKRRQTDFCVCFASGDPHYTAFDNQKIHFQGECTYTLSKTVTANNTCAFSVEVKNNHRGHADVTFTKVVHVNTRKAAISLLPKGELWIDGQKRFSPVVKSRLGLSVTQSGQYIEILTACGVEIGFDGRHKVIVRVPKNMAADLTGICGNCNNRRDDYRTAYGVDVKDKPDRYSLIGNSYLVDDPLDLNKDVNCSKTPQEMACTASLMELGMDEMFCGRMINVTGPFGDCLREIEDKVKDVFDQCILDVCAYGNEPHLRTEVTCMNMEALASVCESAGVKVDWRRHSGCPIKCPPNSHYNPLMSGCQATCLGHAPHVCPLAEREGCQCDPGYVLDNGHCIQQEDCGCNDANNFYIPLGTSVISDDCTKQYKCESSEYGSMLVTSSTGRLPCSKDAFCSTRSGLLQCVCKPDFIGDGHTCTPTSQSISERLTDPNVPPTTQELYQKPEISNQEPHRPSLHESASPKDNLPESIPEPPRPIPDDPLEPNIPPVQKEIDEPIFHVEPDLIPESIHIKENEVHTEDIENIETPPQLMEGPSVQKPLVPEIRHTEPVLFTTDQMKEHPPEEETIDEMFNKDMPEPVTHYITPEPFSTTPVNERGPDFCHCLAKGDPHYHTFDGSKLEVYHPCKYVMAETTVKRHPCAFRVEVKNEKRPTTSHPTRAYIRLLDIRLPDDTIRLHVGGSVFVNGKQREAPLVSRDAVISSDEKWTNVTTACNVTVAFDGVKVAVIDMPAAYRTWTRGLCGDCDGNGQNDVEVNGKPIYKFNSVNAGYRAISNQFLIADDSDSPDVSKMCQPHLHPLNEDDWLV